MATSPNFGWLEPDNTDLVKNGALAIRTLGNAIDSSMAGLKGGTTGQVLSKTSGTDMAFTWTTPSSSSTLTYPINPVLNSNFSVWQRGTSFTVASATSTYTADRWQAYRGATGMTVTRQSSGQTGSQYAMRVARDSGNTSTVAIQMAQTFETVNSILYAGQSITFSFYARAGANYSPTSSALAVYVQTGTGTDQNYYGGLTGSSNIVNGSTATLTTSWQRFTYTATVGSTATQLAIAFVSNPTGTAGANDYYEVTGVQIDVGSTAQTYRPAGATYQAELAACQRYFVKFGDTNQSYGVMSWGQAYATTNVMSFVPLPVTMRTKPASISFTGLRVNDWTTYISVTTMAIENNYTTPQLLALVATVTGATTKIPYTLGQDNNSGGKLEVSAEL